jgi:2'-5' RNA ligase
MRLFAAIELPEAVRVQLTALQNGVPGARWVPPENLHLTLAFLGELDRHAAEDVDSAFAAIGARPFDLTLRAVGLFGAPPRVLWAGVERSQPLLHLAEKVMTAAMRTGVDLDRRKFASHVTLARLRDAPQRAVQEFLAAHGHFASDRFTVSRFVLFSSHRGKEQAAYRAERYYVF